MGKEKIMYFSDLDFMKDGGILQSSFNYWCLDAKGNMNMEPSHDGFFDICRQTDSVELIERTCPTGIKLLIKEGMYLYDEKQKSLIIFGFFREEKNMKAHKAYICVMNNIKINNCEVIR